ncbi:argininosuccinate synthase [Sorangium sp. So ce1036]|uniref:argininosuccinate synthase n=1 Tax=Sorangium sp. So ce1036 TaxID=3133328 RepID=UPI003EFC4EC8
MKIILAYSGGLDTSVALRWLTERYDAEVVAYCADIGQPGDMAEVRRRALASGAAAVRIEDLRDTYIRDHVFPALRANAAYEGRYLMAAPLGRPLIARRLAEIALEEGAQAVAHGASGKGNDQVRFYTTVIAFAPGLKVIAPLAEWELKSRDDEIAYANARGIEIPVTRDRPYSMDGSLWGTSTECGILEDPGARPPPDAFQITTDPELAPDRAEEVTIGFERGLPVSVDGERVEPVPLVERLGELGGRHGIGRVDIVENSLLGIKTRAIYECPAGTLLHRAHCELESLVLDRDTLHCKRQLEVKYAELVYNGLWFSPLRRSLDAFMADTQRQVDGVVTLRLYKGNVSVVDRRSPSALFSYSLSSHDPRDRYDHPAALGFSYVWSMPLRVRAMTFGPAGDDSPARVGPDHTADARGLASKGESGQRAPRR